MALPSGVETVTVSSGIPLTLPNGRWIEGELIITGPDLVTIGEDDLVFGGGVPVPLVDGEFTVRLVATDATGMSPTGWTYRVESRFTNATNWTRYISLPKASPSVKLSDIVVPDPVAGTYSTLVDPSALTGVVRTTGDQVIGGEKNFGERIPLGPGFDPEFDNQLTRKAYVDAKVSAAGGGSAIRTADVRITAGDVTLPSAGSWSIVTSGTTQLAAAVKGAVGDRIQASPSFMRAGGGSFLDLSILAADGTPSRYFGTDSSTPLTEGHPSYYPQASSFPGVPGTMQIVVGAGEVDSNGKVTIALVHKGSGGETIYAGGTYPFFLLLTNIGPEPA